MTDWLALDPSKGRGFVTNAKFASPLNLVVEIENISFSSTRFESDQTTIGHSSRSLSTRLSILFVVNISKILILTPRLLMLVSSSTTRNWFAKAEFEEDPS
jgi:hypothetical protein